MDVIVSVLFLYSLRESNWLCGCGWYTDTAACLGWMWDIRLGLSFLAHAFYHHLITIYTINLPFTTQPELDTFLLWFSLFSFMHQHFSLLWHLLFNSFIIINIIPFSSSADVNNYNQILIFFDCYRLIDSLCLNKGNNRHLNIIGITEPQKTICYKFIVLGHFYCYFKSSPFSGDDDAALLSMV